MFFDIYSNIAYFISKTIFKISLLAFFNLKVKGRENFPVRGGFIIAGNHVSYMDPPIVGAACKRRLYFITAPHLYKGVLISLWYWSTGCIKVNSGRPSHKVMKKILDYLKKGRVVAMFPEGTRSHDGRMKEPLAGIGFLALKAQVPVIPCLIRGSEKALPRGAKAFSSARISAYIGRPIESKGFKCKEGRKEAYRLFSKRVMEAITQLETEHGD